MSIDDRQNNINYSDRARSRTRYNQPKQIVLMTIYINDIESAH